VLPVGPVEPPSLRYWGLTQDLDDGLQLRQFVLNGQHLKQGACLKGQSQENEHIRRASTIIFWSLMLILSRLYAVKDYVTLIIFIINVFDLKK
jgi:hypothetical protein